MTEQGTIENVVYGICLDDCRDPGMPEFLSDLRNYLSKEKDKGEGSWYLLLEEKDRMSDWLRRLAGILGFEMPEGIEILWTGPDDYRIGLSDTPPELLILGFHSSYVYPQEWETDWHCSRWPAEFVQRASIHTWTESAE